MADAALQGLTIVLGVVGLLGTAIYSSDPRIGLPMTIVGFGGAWLMLTFVAT